MQGRYLYSLSFVNDLPVEFMSKIAFLMTQESFTQDDNIIVEGEHGGKIYFITTGKVAMLHK